MANVTLSREEALQRVKTLCSNGKWFEAKQLLFAILDKMPLDKESRGYLTQIVARQNPTNSGTFVKRFEKAVMSQPKFFLENASKGWRYALTIDSAFLDESIEAPKRRRASKADPHSISASELQGSASPEELLDELAAIPELEARWLRATELIHAPERAVLEDDFPSLEGEELNRALQQCQSEERLNLVVLGAGCMGLTLANAFQNAFQSKVNILIIEKRIQAPHIKRPYNREWLTHIPTKLCDGLLDPALARLLDDFGKENFMGTTIGLLETLLLLSNRRQGVRFLFHDACDLTFLEKAKTHLVFDATGGRFDPDDAALEPGAFRNASKPVTMTLETPQGFSRGHAEHGVTKVTPASAHQIVGEVADGVLEPVVEGERIQTAMFKLTHVPVELYEPLLEFVKPKNHDSLFYVWPGNLAPELNELLLLINLDSDGFDTLARHVNAPMPLSKAIEAIGNDHQYLDTRIIELFDFLRVKGVDLDSIGIEPPFLYAPQARLMTGACDRLHGRPLIPIGDSIFNGHPKAGNGLGTHFKHIRKLLDFALVFYGN